ncbi:MAG TPA: type II CAAX endopeptidase family protein [Gemmatimonadaceae bacterium]|nr:type II CAAX endopeptidase family protein [Gemmatimonadaceae bacterium]
MPDTTDLSLPQQPMLFRRLFTGQNGMRAGWRLLLYIAMVIGLGWIIRWVAHSTAGARGGSTPGVERPVPMIITELALLLAVIAPAMVMARVERRSLADYGLPWRTAFRGDFWAGMLWGLVIVTTMVGGIALLGGYTISGLALSGGAIVGYGAIWLVAFLLVGWFEEFAFRGYTQFTLATGIGFWPAVIVLSVAFGAAHLGNPNEDLLGALVVALFGIFLGLTLRRTGSLWFAIGLHCAFDWGESYLYAVPDSGGTSVGHLVTSSMHGARWLTGGSVGPEDSVICFVCLFVAMAVFAWRYPGSRTSYGG